VGGAFVSDKDEADSLQADLAAIYTPPNFDVREVNYWVEMNKNILCQILTTGVANGVLNFAFLQTTPDLARKWSTKDATFVTSPRVDGKEPSTKAATSSGKGGTIQISLKSYLLLLLNTWQTVGIGAQGRFSQVPQRWIDWLTLLISRYDRYTPSQIYGFLGQIDFSANPPKL